MNDASDEAVRLLTEIRDLQRAHYEAYEQAVRGHKELNQASVETAKAQYRAQNKTAQATFWAIMTLLAVCVAANLFMLAHVASTR
jgi:ferric-dicitrate binding protein FerR (iron transport regulator)